MVDVYSKGLKMRINNCFYSIQGEGINWGIPMNFVRLQGCNVKCRWCDTKESWDPYGGTEMSVEEIMAKSVISKSKPRSVNWFCITGGEPLMQMGEVESLVKAIKWGNVFRFEICTNGTLAPPSWFSTVDSWSVDYKCPSSGVESVAIGSWISKLRVQDQIKFVVKDQDDLDFVDRALGLHYIPSSVIVSPVFPMISLRFTSEVVEFVKSRNLRLSIQNHKIIGVK